MRYACRSYRKTPSFTFVALLSLTLAIGANSAIFSLLNALVLRKLPVRDPSGLVQVTTVTRTDPEAAFTYSMFEELSREQQVFASMIGWWGHTIVSAEIDGARADVFLWATSGNLHSELGLTPAAGRLFSTSDMDLARPSAEPVAVIGYAFARERVAAQASNQRYGLARFRCSYHRAVGSRARRSVDTNASVPRFLRRGGYSAGERTRFLVAG